MALQTLLQQYVGQIYRRMQHTYDGGHVLVTVPELPGITAAGHSEREAEMQYMGLFSVWLVKQLEAGYPVPPLGEHEINSDYNRQLFSRETGIESPLLAEQPDPDQMWFWTPEWQAKEQESDEDRDSGRFDRFLTDAEFDAALEAHE